MLGEDMLEMAKREIEIYLKYGVYPLVENYLGTSADCEKVLAWLLEYHPKAVYEVNILGDAEEAFLLAKAYGARFIQIDSVCDHLEPDRDEEYADYYYEYDNGKSYGWSFEELEDAYWDALENDPSNEWNID